jgi:rhodanese-related sulfurtransferase
MDRVSSTAGPPAPPARPSAARGVLAEAALVLLGGLVFALIANQLSPRGLSLTRDYFAAGGKRVASSPGPMATQPANSEAPAGTVTAELRRRGIREISLTQAAPLYRQARRARRSVVFVDARDDAHYEAGHIPGALQFDYYHPENYLLPVLDACQNATQIVVYCTGGDCDDSEFAAVMLNQAGVPAAKLQVFAGGYGEWTNHNLPVEIGARRESRSSGSKP